MICLSPFCELHVGEKSIHEFVQDGYAVPNRVIQYLKTTRPYMMSPGIYEHPFKPGAELLGPYFYTDGKYFWDRDMWKYVLKYHVTLPQTFIDHVMSDEGLAYLKEFFQKPDSWSGRIAKMKESGKGICHLPDDAGDMKIDSF